MWLFNQYHEAIATRWCRRSRPTPAARESSSPGASIGAFNALAMVCRYPQLFRAGDLHERDVPHGEVHRRVQRRPLLLARRCTSCRGWRARSSTCCASGSSSWPPAPVAGRTSGSRGRSANVLGEQGDPQPGRRLGPGVRPRLADLVEDAPDLRGRDRRMTADAWRRRSTGSWRRLATTSSGSWRSRRWRRRSGSRVPAGRAAAELVERLYREARRRRHPARSTPTTAASSSSVGPPVRPARHGCCSTRTTTSSRPATQDAWSSDPWTLTERDGRWYGAWSGGLQGQPRHAPHRAARAARRRRRLAGGPDASCARARRRCRPAGWSGSSPRRARAVRGRRHRRRGHRQRRGGRPDGDDQPAGDRQRPRDRADAGRTRALRACTGGRRPMRWPR